MNLFRRLRKRIARRRRQRRALSFNEEVREFAYLDEVSVYSLYASKIGAVAAEFTESQSRSLQGEFSGSMKANAGFLGAEVSSGMRSENTEGSQVLRKAVVQSTFRELYDSIQQDLVLRPIDQKRPVTKFENVDEIATYAQGAAEGPLALRSTELRRGQLMEIEVELEAEAVFRISEVITSLLGLLDESPELIDTNTLQQLSQVRSVGKLVRSLLNGLVPLKGTAVDFVVAHVNDDDYIVNKHSLPDVMEVTDLDVVPLHIVGVASQRLFWKDVRQILFSRSRFRVLCRVAVDGLSRDWRPVKLADVVSSVVPDLGEQLNALGTVELPRLARGIGSSGTTENKQELLRMAYETYAKGIAARSNIELAIGRLDEVKRLSFELSRNTEGVVSRRNAFAKIAEAVAADVDQLPTPEVLAELREDSMREATLDFFGEAMHVVSHGGIDSGAEVSCFLEAEIVALYW